MLSIKSGYDLFCPNFDEQQVERVFLWFIKAIKKHTLTERKEWFRGRDVCMILGFKNINDTHLKGEKQSHKTDLKSLVELTCMDHANSTSYHEGKTVYICSAESPGDLNLQYLT